MLMGFKESCKETNPGKMYKLTVFVPLVASLTRHLASISSVTMHIKFLGKSD